jgi:hypothetical protein
MWMTSSLLDEHDAHRARRAVLLVIGVQREEHVERLLDGGVRPVLRLRHLEHHVQEVAGVAQVVVGIDDRQTPAVAVRVGRERRDLRQDPDHLQAPGVRVREVLGLRIERRERAHRADEDPHRVSVVSKAVDELAHVLVHERVQRDLALERRELLLRRKVTVHEEVDDLEERRALGELFDRVAAVPEDALVTVDERDLGRRRRRVRERGVVRHQAEVLLVDLHLTEVHRADRPVLDRELERLARSVVGDGQRVLRHEFSGVAVRRAREGRGPVGGAGFWRPASGM